MEGLWQLPFVKLTVALLCTSYVQVLGFPGTITEAAMTAHFVHTPLEPSGTFSTASPLFTQIQHATRFAALSNSMDIPTDCPQREVRYNP